MPEGVETSLPPPPVEKDLPPEESTLTSPQVNEPEESLPLPPDQVPENEGIAEAVLGDSFRHGVEKEKEGAPTTPEETGKVAGLAKDVVNVAQLVATELIDHEKGEHREISKAPAQTLNIENMPKDDSQQSELKDQTEQDNSQTKPQEEEKKEEVPVAPNEPVTTN